MLTKGLTSKMRKWIDYMNINNEKVILNIFFRDLSIV